MNLHAELVNLWLFVLAIAKTVLMCGYVAIPVALADFVLNLFQVQTIRRKTHSKS
jgi:uncharacterized protein YunC (DUF1805 family)